MKVIMAHADNHGFVYNILNAPSNKVACLAPYRA